MVNYRFNEDMNLYTGLYASTLEEFNFHYELFVIYAVYILYAYLWLLTCLAIFHTFSA